MLLIILGSRARQSLWACNLESWQLYHVHERDQRFLTEHTLLESWWIPVIFILDSVKLYRVNGPSDEAKRLPNVLNISFSGIKSTDLLYYLQEKIAASAGSGNWVNCPLMTVSLPRRGTIPIPCDWSIRGALGVRLWYLETFYRFYSWYFHF